MRSRADRRREVERSPQVRVPRNNQNGDRKNLKKELHRQDHNKFRRICHSGSGENSGAALFLAEQCALLSLVGHLDN